MSAPNKGDCYEAAGTVILSREFPGAVLCHGYIYVGVPHAWVEAEIDGVPMVIDRSRHESIQTTVRDYYATRVLHCADEVVRYTSDEAAALIAKTGHWGKWLKYEGGKS